MPNTSKLVMLAIVMVTAAVRADDRAQAEALFMEARQLMAQGDYVAACPKFEASDRLDHAIGTELNLAQCWERLGRTASAWALYTSVASSPNDLARATFARNQATRLFPTLSRLTVQLPSIAGARWTLDGKPMDAAASFAMPVDPGNHVIEATAPSRTTFHRVVTIGANAAQVTVAVAF